MRELVFLLEEASAKALLESLLPRVLSPKIQHRLIPFEGKQDLEKQMIRRLRHYANPRARFIVLRDQDSDPDCRGIKVRLLKRCREAGKEAACLVRIACTELETFYLADLQAVDTALETGNLANRQGSDKYRLPDRLGSPSKELTALSKGKYQKISGSRAIGRHLDLENGRSPSFRNLIAGIRRLEADLLSMDEE